MPDNQIVFSAESRQFEEALDKMNKLLERQGKVLTQLSVKTGEYDKKTGEAIQHITAIASDGTKVMTQMATVADGTLRRISNSTKSTIQKNTDNIKKLFKQITDKADIWGGPGFENSLSKSQKAVYPEWLKQRKKLEDDLNKALIRQQKETSREEQRIAKQQAVAQKKLNAEIRADDERRFKEYQKNLNEQANAFERVVRRQEAAQARLARQRAGIAQTIVNGDAPHSLVAGVQYGMSNDELRRMQAAFGRVDSVSARFVDMQNKRAKSWYLNWDFWSRYVVTRVLNSVSYSFINASRQSVMASIDLQKSIALIQTISSRSAGDTRNTFGKWVTDIRKLSDEFGVAVKDVGEGVYETISNQIADGSKAIDFMSTALQFAVTTGSSAKESMDLLSSVINAFSLNAESATPIAASLFKTIDLGRVKAKEMADTYGRIAPMAARLGLSYNDLNTSIAVGTISGIKFNVASTEILNIMNKLLKPTKEMQKLLKSWGYETGQDMVAAEGWAGTLEKLNRVIQQQGMAYGSKLFNDIRAIRGVMNQTRDDMRAFNKTYNEFNGGVEGKSPMESYLKAIQTSFEPAGKKLEMELNKIKNIFVNDIGEEATKVMLSLIKYFGGANQIVSELGSALKHLSAVLLSMKLATIDAEVAFGGLFGAGQRNIASLERHQLAMAKIVAGYEQQRIAQTISVDGLAREAIARERLVMVTNQLTAAQERAALVSSRIWGFVRGIGWMVAIEVGFKAIEYGWSVIKDRIEESAAEDTKYTGTVIENTIKRMGQFEREQRMRDDIIKEHTERTLKYIAAENTQYTEQEQNLKERLKNQAKVLKEMWHKIDDAPVKTLQKSMDSIVKVLQSRVELMTKAIEKFHQNISKSETVMTNILEGDTQRSKIVEMIEAIGKVDEGWTKARKSLAQYQQGVNQSRLSKEDQDYNKKYQALLNYRRMLIGQAEGAYAADNPDQGRKLMSESLSMADKLYQYGWSLNEVYKERQILLQKQLELEDQYRKGQKAQSEEVKKKLNIERDKISEIQGLRTKLVNKIKEAKDKKEDPEKYKSEFDDLTTKIAKSLKGIGQFDAAAMIEMGLGKDQFNIGINELNKTLTDQIAKDDSLKEVVKKLDIQITAVDKYSAELAKMKDEVQRYQRRSEDAQKNWDITKAALAEKKALQDKYQSEKDDKLKEKEAIKSVQMEEYKKNIDRTQELKNLIPNAVRSLPYMDALTASNFKKNGQFQGLFNTGILEETKGTEGLLYSINEKKLSDYVGKNDVWLRNELNQLATNATSFWSGKPPKELTNLIAKMQEVSNANKGQKELVDSIKKLDDDIIKLNNKIAEVRGTPERIVQKLPDTEIHDGYITKNGRTVKIADDDNVIAFRDYTNFGKLISKILKPSNSNRFNDVFVNANGVFYRVNEKELDKLHLYDNAGDQIEDFKSNDYLIPNWENFRDSNLNSGGSSPLLSRQNAFDFKKTKQGYYFLGRPLILANSAWGLKTLQERNKMAMEGKFAQANKEMDAFINNNIPSQYDNYIKGTATSNWNRKMEDVRSGRVASEIKDKDYYTNKMLKKIQRAKREPGSINSLLDKEFSVSADILARSALNRQSSVSRSLLNDEKYQITIDNETKKVDKFTIKEMKDILSSGAQTPDAIENIKKLFFLLGERINDGLILKDGKVIRTSQDDNIYATKNNFSLNRPDYSQLGKMTDSSRFSNPTVNVNGTLAATLNVSGRQLAKEVVPFIISDSKKGRNNIMVAK